MLGDCRVHSRTCLGQAIRPGTVEQFSYSVVGLRRHVFLSPEEKEEKALYTDDGDVKATDSSSPCQDNFNIGRQVDRERVGKSESILQQEQASVGTLFNLN